MNAQSELWECVEGIPVDSLKSWVRSYSGYSETTTQVVHRLEVAKSQVVVVIGFGDKLQLMATTDRTTNVSCQAFAVSLQSSPLLVKHNGVQRCIEIELLPWVANELFNGAFIDSDEGVIDLVDVWGHNVLLLTEQLSELDHWQQRFSLIDRFLSQRASEARYATRTEIKWAWQQLESSGGCLPIQQLARTLGWSDRHLASSFRRHIGITPKAGARRIRFVHAYQQLMSVSAPNLNNIAISSGYSDQSHFTREFRLFSGCTPTQYQQACFQNLPGTPASVLREN